LVPRPGIEPGLEVPETSVMSFSLPGQKVECMTLIYPTRRWNNRHTDAGQDWLRTVAAI
jgi:hypothetical protein